VNTLKLLNYTVINLSINRLFIIHGCFSITKGKWSVKILLQQPPMISLFSWEPSANKVTDACASRSGPASTCDTAVHEITVTIPLWAVCAFKHCSMHTPYCSVFINSTILPSYDSKLGICFGLSNGNKWQWWV